MCGGVRRRVAVPATGHVNKCKNGHGGRYVHLHVNKYPYERVNELDVAYPLLLPPPLLPLVSWPGACVAANAIILLLLPVRVLLLLLRAHCCCSCRVSSSLLLDPASYGRTRTRSTTTEAPLLSSTSLPPSCSEVVVVGHWLRERVGGAHGSAAPNIVIWLGGPGLVGRILQLCYTSRVTPPGDSTDFEARAFPVERTAPVTIVMMIE
eukprot:GHVU01228816.1.p1 GENE.GHVU01228816.1~~GHVU01228816.1.p1  ORF type:complete len:208 (+),score=14.05 GHVU01228816.1:636-1259(+)